MPIYRVQREPIVTQLAASKRVPAFAGAWVWKYNGPFFGEIYFPKSFLENGTRRMVSGIKVSEAGGYVVYTSRAGKGIAWEDRVYLPPRAEVPAVQPATVVTGKMGWDGGGRGRPLVKDGQRVMFTFTRAGAVQAGLARPGLAYSFSAPRYAWYRHGTVLECMAFGASVYVFSPFIPDNAIVSWRFGIERVPGEIRWGFSTPPYDSFNVVHTSYGDAGQLVPIGMPYTIGDSIDALEITDPAGSLVAELPAVTCRITDSAWANIRTRLPAITAELVSDPTGDLSFTLPALKARFAETAWGAIAGTLPGIEASIRSEPTFAINLLYASLPPLTASFTGYTLTTGEIAATLPAAVGRFEDVSRGRIVGRLGAFSAALSDYHRDFGMDLLVLGFAHSLENPLLLITVDGLTIEDETTIALYMDLITADGLRLADDASLGELVALLVEEGVYISEGGSLTRPEALQYAVNLVTGAPSQYQGFDFLGFVNVAGIAYGWKADGLYRLGANQDEGQAIRALVDFGISDYGTARIKRMAAAWIGVRTDGQTYLKVAADDGKTYVYRATPCKDAHKAILGKGLAGRQWSVTLELADASFASIDSIELEVAVTQRRFGGK